MFMYTAATAADDDDNNDDDDHQDDNNCDVKRCVRSQNRRSNQCEFCRRITASR